MPNKSKFEEDIQWYLLDCLTMVGEGFLPMADMPSYEDVRSLGPTYLASMVKELKESNALLRRIKV